MNTENEQAIEPESKTFLSQGQGDYFDRWIEFLSAIVLSLATVLTAWCGYQAAQWDGEQAKFYNQATSAQVQAANEMNEGMLKSSIHVGLFVEYVAALSADNDELVDFLYSRFPSDLRTATDAWLDLDPLNNPDAPQSPFDIPDYVLEDQTIAVQLQADAEALFFQANEANELSDEYVLLTVLFATVLFFTGIAGKFQWRVIDAAMLILGTLVFAYGLFRLSGSPIL
jgi:hypothetical protein